MYRYIMLLVVQCRLSFTLSRLRHCIIITYTGCDVWIREAWSVTTTLARRLDAFDSYDTIR